MGLINEELAPLAGESIQDFVVRHYQDTGKMYLTAEQLSKTKMFYEVIAAEYTEPIEEWLALNAGKGEYYCTHSSSIPMFTSSWQDKQKEVWHWFFNNEEIAMLFKLAYGSND